MSEPRSITTGIVFVTPDMAADFLSRTYKNQRPVNKNHVTRLAQDMTDGRFELCPDPVVILADNSLANGQHRLWAVIESMHTVPMLVSRGWPESAYKIMDAGFRRALAYRVDAKWLRVAKALACVRATVGGLQPWRTNQLSEQQIVAFAVAHDDVFEVLMDMPQSRNVRSAVVAACARAMLNGADHESVRRFLAVCATGVSDGAHEAAAVRMFVVLTDTHRGAAGSGAPALMYGKALCALRAFLKRQPLSKIVALDDDSFWPLPSDSPLEELADAAPVFP